MDTSHPGPVNEHTTTPTDPPGLVGGPRWPAQHKAALFVAAAVFSIGLSAPLAYVVYAREDAYFAMEYGSYLLPACAAITAAMTVFEWKVVELFWLSLLLVVSGLALFTFLHGHLAEVATMVVVVLGLALTVSLIPLTHYIEKKRAKPLAWQGVVGLAVLIFVVALAINIPGIIRYGLEFQRKPSTVTCLEQGRNLDGRLVLQCSKD